MNRIVNAVRAYLACFAVFAGLVVGASVLLFSSSPTYAATLSGLSIYPLRTEPEIAPGVVYSGHLTISNTTLESIDVTMSAEKFGVINEQYDYSFDPGSSLVDWVRFDPSVVTLEPNKSQIISYTISVPNGAEPRGQYISLFATSQKKKDSSGITSQERVASLLYITVEGPVSRVGKILSLRSPWLMTGPSKWTAQLQNTGSTHYRSVYSVKTETLLGTEIGSSAGNNLILPASVRLLEGKIAQPKVPGIYKLVFDVGLGDNPAAHVTKVFLYLRPGDLVILGILVLVIAVLRLTHRKKKVTKD